MISNWRTRIGEPELKKPENLEKNRSEQRKEPTTNLTHICPPSGTEPGLHCMDTDRYEQQHIHQSHYIWTVESLLWALATDLAVERWKPETFRWLELFGFSYILYFTLNKCLACLVRKGNRQQHPMITQNVMPTTYYKITSRNKFTENRNF